MLICDHWFHAVFTHTHTYIYIYIYIHTHTYIADIQNATQHSFLSWLQLVWIQFSPRLVSIQGLKCSACPTIYPYVYIWYMYIHMCMYGIYIYIYMCVCVVYLCSFLCVCVCVFWRSEKCRVFFPLHLSPP